MRLSLVLIATLLAGAIFHPNFARAADAPTMAAPAAAAASASGKASSSDEDDSDSGDHAGTGPPTYFPIVAYATIAVGVFAVILLPEYLRWRKSRVAAAQKDDSP
jgi:hypothetical protein